MFSSSQALAGGVKASRRVFAGSGLFLREAAGARWLGEGVQSQPAAPEPTRSKAPAGPTRLWLGPREGLGKLRFKLLLNAKPDLLVAGWNDFGRTGVVFIYRLVL